MSYKEVIVDVEPRNKEFHVAVMRETTVEEVINTLVQRCQDEGIKISDWGRSKVGQSNVSFVLMRKATGNTAIAPTVTFGELFPDLEDRETFKLDARAQVGDSDPDREPRAIDGQPDYIREENVINVVERLTDYLTKELHYPVEEVHKFIEEKLYAAELASTNFKLTPTDEVAKMEATSSDCYYMLLATTDEFGNEKKFTYFHELVRLAIGSLKHTKKFEQPPDKFIDEWFQYIDPKLEHITDDDLTMLVTELSRLIPRHDAISAISDHVCVEVHGRWKEIPEWLNGKFLSHRETLEHIDEYILYDGEPLRNLRSLFIAVYKDITKQLPNN